MAAALYATMRRKLAIVRRRLQKPLTLADKVLLGHLDAPETQDLEPGRSYLALRPDRVVFQDVLGQSGMLQFMQTKRGRVAVPTTIHCDHLIQARTNGEADLRASLDESKEVYDFLRSAAAKYGCGFWEPGAGIIHQVVLETLRLSGRIDHRHGFHTPNAGGLGACAVGVGGADAVEVISGLPWEVLYPRHIAVYLTGELGGWAAPKDVILYVAGQLTVSGGTNAIVEYIGPGARSISATGKATITNMGAELGATTSMFPADERMATYLRATGREFLVAAHATASGPAGAGRGGRGGPRGILRPGDQARSEHARAARGRAAFARPRPPDFQICLRDRGQRQRLCRCNLHGFDRKLHQLVLRRHEPRRRHRRAGEAHGIKAAVPLLVTPGSEQVRATIERDGQMQSLEDIDATVLANACGPCIGQWRRASEAAGAPNTIVTSYNRNFPRRNDGQPTTMNFIASPEIVTAFALAGRLSFNPLKDTLTGGDGNRSSSCSEAPRPRCRRRTSRPGERPMSLRAKAARTSS